jgi:hypothetical protein
VLFRSACRCPAYEIPRCPNRLPAKGPLGRGIRAKLQTRRHRRKKLSALPGLCFLRPTVLGAVFSVVLCRTGVGYERCYGYPIAHLPRSFLPIDPEGLHSRFADLADTLLLYRTVHILSPSWGSFFSTG